MFMSFMWPQVLLLFHLKCMVNLTKTNLIKFRNVLLIKYLGVHLHLYLKVVSGVSVHEWISFEWECLYSCEDIQSQNYSQQFWKKKNNPHVFQCVYVHPGIGRQRCLCLSRQLTQLQWHRFRRRAALQRPPRAKHCSGLAHRVYIYLGAVGHPIGQHQGKSGRNCHCRQAKYNKF